MVPQKPGPAAFVAAVGIVLAIALVAMLLALAWPSEAGAAKRYPGRQRVPTATAQPCVSVSEVDPLMEGVYRATVDGRRGLVRVISRRAPALIAGCWDAGQFAQWFSVEGE